MSKADEKILSSVCIDNNSKVSKSKTRATKNEIELNKVEKIIKDKINDFIDKYNKYPKYLKLPLWISNCMKQVMRDMSHFNLDYNTGLLLYRNLVVCETITITQPEEIEVF